VDGKHVRSGATAGLPVSAPGSELEDVSFASAATGWATVSLCATGSGANCNRNETLYRTLDGGSVWAPLNVSASARRTR